MAGIFVLFADRNLGDRATIACLNWNVLNLFKLIIEIPLLW